VPGYPDAIAGYILYLKQLYPPIHLREIVRIVHRKFGYKTNHHTLKRFLAPYDTPHQLELALPTFATFQHGTCGRACVMWPTPYQVTGTHGSAGRG
jgi:hypothetical protein